MHGPLSERTRRSLELSEIFNKFRFAVETFDVSKDLWCEVHVGNVDEELKAKRIAVLKVASNIVLEGALQRLKQAMEAFQDYESSSKH